MSFDPNSTDAMFAKVLARLEEQDRAASKTNSDFLLVLHEIRAEAKKTNGRITNLEFWRAKITAKTVAYASAISTFIGFAGWVLEHWAKIVGP